MTEVRAARSCFLATTVPDLAIARAGGRFVMQSMTYGVGFVMQSAIVSMPELGD